MLSSLGPRIVIVGTSGSGKTTLARRVAERLDIPHVELDALRHGPNWAPAPWDVFRARFEAATSGPAWVVDGNYSAIRDAVWSKANTLVWLQYPFHIVFWRLWWRTIRRGISRQELWNGNRESLSTAFFSRDSILLWAI